MRRAAALLLQACKPSQHAGLNAPAALGAASGASLQGTLLAPACALSSGLWTAESREQQRPLHQRAASGRGAPPPYHHQTLAQGVQQQQQQQQRGLSTTEELRVL